MSSVAPDLRFFAYFDLTLSPWEYHADYGLPWVIYCFGLAINLLPEGCAFPFHEIHRRQLAASARRPHPSSRRGPRHRGGGGRARRSRIHPTDTPPRRHPAGTAPHRARLVAGRGRRARPDG